MPKLAGVRGVPAKTTTCNWRLSTARQPRGFDTLNEESRKGISGASFSRSGQVAVTFSVLTIPWRGFYLPEVNEGALSSLIRYLFFPGSRSSRSTFELPMFGRIDVLDLGDWQIESGHG
ncbi:MAG TPA: hypothetical protein VK090_03310 [Paracoccaceae bacterium]|nr:hypothetical protein [Paracoccaceae bacterium]